MHPDENIGKAFESLQAAYRVDTFSQVPHPENLKFRAEAEDWFMHRLGLQLVHIAESQDQPWVGRTIQRYFRKELGYAHLVGDAHELPRFLLRPGHRMDPRVDPTALTAQMTGLALPKQETICIVASQLNLLKKLLYLSDAETKWLKLAYASSSHDRCVEDHSDNLHVALQPIGLHDEGHRNRALAALLDEPLAAIEAMFQPPIAMVALRFIDMTYLDRHSNLLDVVSPTDEFIELLECTHRSHAAFLAAILEPEFDANLANDVDTSIGALYERFPQPLAACYERAVLGRPLNMSHIRLIVERFTGYATLPTQYAPLAGRITFEGIREALKRATLNCRKANGPVTRYELFKGLYDAST